jgi:hypothetical protein
VDASGPARGARAILVVMTAVMPMLVVRLHVDLKRVATAVCRAA